MGAVCASRTVYLVSAARKPRLVPLAAGIQGGPRLLLWGMAGEVEVHVARPKQPGCGFKQIQMSRGRVVRRRTHYALRHFQNGVHCPTSGLALGQEAKVSPAELGGELGHFSRPNSNLRLDAMATEATGRASRTRQAVPDPGQLVVVRDRRWVVSDISRSSVEPDVLGRPDGHPQHVVTLASIEEDAAGEELRVIWELEPGRQILDHAVLPTPDPQKFDDPERLDAFLDAVRWGAIASADPRYLQAPFRSGITIEDYQLDPVVRALRMPRVNLLIADDVGLGKTIEAGLVVQELLLRHRARTILVVCPASLGVKWQTEMAEKFGLEFRIVNRELLRELRRTRGLHVNPFTHFPRLIVSIDYLKRDHVMRLMKEVLPARSEYPRAFDLLIVDEAHGIAPSGRGRYATDSLRTRTHPHSRAPLRAPPVHDCNPTQRIQGEFLRPP